MCSKDVTIIQRLLEGLTPLAESDVASMDIRWKNVEGNRIKTIWWQNSTAFIVQREIVPVKKAKTLTFIIWIS